MGTEKRERQKAQRAARIEAERAAEARARRIKTARNLVLAGIGVVVLILVMSALSGCSSDQDAKSKPTTGTDDAKGCPPEGGADTPKTTFKAAPPMCIDPSKHYTAIVTTTEGTVTVKLDTTKTPRTTNNFVFLARWGYFDDTKLFRTEAQSGIIQGGSPHTQSNADAGPGYTIKDEGIPFKMKDYGPGTLAMANTGQPNSGGAQFFFLANQNGKYLGDPAQGPTAGTYAVFGKTSKGLDVLTKISKLDDGNTVPTKDVRIETVKITES